MLTGILLFLVGALCYIIYLLWGALKAQELELIEDAEQIDYLWTWLINANGRRKRVERYLKKQQGKYRRLTAEHQALAADLVGELLAAQDRESVAKSLTRRVVP